MRINRIIVQFAVYFILPCFFLGAAFPLTHIPGAQRSDVWNAMWSLYWFSESLFALDLTFQAPLNVPHGGQLWPADPLNAVLIRPLIAVFSIGTAYTILCVFLHVLLGWATHQWVSMLQPKGHPMAHFAAGLTLQSSGIVLVAIHNGSSEAMSACWVILSLWHLCLLIQEGKGVLRTTVFLVLAFWSSWYLALITAIFALAIISVNRRGALKWPLIVLAVALALALPLALISLEFSSGAGNLLRIKSPAALEQVRRTVGSAEVLSYFWPTHRAPDFRFISRFGEQFVHSTYLGCGLILAAFFALRQTPSWVLVAGGICFLLSLGPVLVVNAEPLVLNESLVIPLPYSLIEGLPGFNQLSLLYRLAFGVQLALVLAMAFRKRPTRAWILWLVLILCENVAHAAYLNVPHVTALPSVAAAEQLADAPDGGVAHYPHVAARPTLYWQIFHGKPVAGSLNFPHNAASKRIWKAALDAESATEANFKQRITAAARKGQIRYLVVMKDPTAMPDLYRKSALRIQEAYGIYASDTLIDVVRFW